MNHRNSHMSKNLRPKQGSIRRGGRIDIHLQCIRRVSWGLGLWGGLVLVIITGIGLADPSSQLSPRRALLSPGQENYFKFMVEKLVLVICRFPYSISA